MLTVFLTIFVSFVCMEGTNESQSTYEGLRTITHNEMVKLNGDIIAIYWDSKTATDEQKQVLRDLSNISHTMSQQGFNPILLIDKQNKANADAFNLPHFKDTPRLLMHLSDENVTELMNSPFDTPHISAFVVDRIQRGNPEDVYSFISEEDLLEFYEEQNRKPILLFFASKMCKTCSGNHISIQRLATAFKDKIIVFMVNCDGTIDENNYCSRIMMQSFPHLMLLADNVFTSYNGTYSTHSIGAWVLRELEEGRKDARKQEWSARSKDVFDSKYFEEVGKNAYDKKGRPKEWPMKPNIRRTIQQMENLEKRITSLEKDIDI